MAKNAMTFSLATVINNFHGNESEDINFFEPNQTFM